MGTFNDTLENEYMERQQLKADEFWYSFNNQKVLAYQMAKDLIVHADMEIDDAIEMAKEYVDQFYHKAIKHGAWERK